MKWVFLPGMEGSGLLFAPIIEQLEPSAQADIISYPGDELLDYDALFEYVTNRLPKQEPYILIAESFSGPIAYRIALTQPAMLKSVVWVASFIARPETKALAWCRFRRVNQLMKLPLPVWMLKRFVLGPDADSQLVSLFRSAMSKVSVAVLHCRALAMLNLPKPNQTISFPALYIQATNDRLVSTASLSACQSVLAGLQIKQIKSSHFILQTHPKQSVSAIQEFLQNLA